MLPLIFISLLRKEKKWTCVRNGTSQSVIRLRLLMKPSSSVSVLRDEFTQTLNKQWRRRNMGQFKSWGFCGEVWPVDSDRTELNSRDDFKSAVECVCLCVCLCVGCSQPVLARHGSARSRILNSSHSNTHTRTHTAVFFFFFLWQKWV